MAGTKSGTDGWCGRCATRCRAATFFMQVLTIVCVLGLIVVTIYYNAPEKGDGKQCVSGPCKNGGACSESGSTYVCKCSTGHVGRDCETPNPCADSPCHNGGSCSMSGDTFVCRCPLGYSGSLCDIEHNPCEPNPCKNSGTCSKMEEGYRCSCTSGYLGNTCQDDDPCLPNPCKNSGNCSISGDNFFCLCPPSHVGTVCESDKTHQEVLADNTHHLNVIMILDSVVLGLFGLSVIIGIICFVLARRNSDD